MVVARINLFTNVDQSASLRYCTYYQQSNAMTKITFTNTEASREQTTTKNTLLTYYTIANKV
jgi:hypothetical protein